MPDISMCMGIGCPDKEKCWRYTAVVSEFRQSFAEFYKSRAFNGVCQNLWPNIGKRNRPIVDGKRAPMFKEVEE